MQNHVPPLRSNYPALKSQLRTLELTWLQWSLITLCGFTRASMSDGFSSLGIFFVLMPYSSHAPWINLTSLQFLILFEMSNMVWTFTHGALPFLAFRCVSLNCLALPCIAFPAISLHFRTPSFANIATVGQRWRQVRPTWRDLMLNLYQAGVKLCRHRRSVPRWRQVGRRGRQDSANLDRAGAQITDSESRNRIPTEGGDQHFGINIFPVRCVLKKRARVWHLSDG